MPVFGTQHLRWADPRPYTNSVDGLDLVAVRQANVREPTQKLGRGGDTGEQVDLLCVARLPSVRPFTDAADRERETGGGEGAQASGCADRALT